MAELVECWGEIAQVRVPPLPVVKPLDVVRHVCSELLDRGVAPLAQPLHLERGEEALDDSVVPVAPPPAHAADDGVMSEHRLVRGAGIQHPPIRMMQEAGTRPPRHSDRGVLY